MISLSNIPSLLSLALGETENYPRYPVPNILIENMQDNLGLDFSDIISYFCETCRDKEILKLEKLYIYGSYNSRNDSENIDHTLLGICNTFSNLKILAIKHASCLLHTYESIASLSLLSHLEVLDFRKSELSIFKINRTDNPTGERTKRWCDSYLHYFPKRLHTLYIEIGIICFFLILVAAIFLVLLLL